MNFLEVLALIFLTYYLARAVLWGFKKRKMSRKGYLTMRIIALLGDHDQESALSLTLISAFLKAPEKEVLVRLSELTKFSLVLSETRQLDGRPQRLYWMSRHSEQPIAPRATPDLMN
jgi:predicted ArsR family transcriptional regulator